MSEEYCGGAVKGSTMFMGESSGKVTVYLKTVFGDKIGKCKVSLGRGELEPALPV